MRLFRRERKAEVVSETTAEARELARTLRDFSRSIKSITVYGTEGPDAWDLTIRAARKIEDQAELIDVLRRQLDERLWAEQNRPAHTLEVEPS